MNRNVVVYYNADGCTPCRMDELYSWKNIMEENSDEETPINVDFVFIFKSEKGSEGFRQKLISTSFNYPVLCDPAGEFEKNNTLPKNELYHVFLLDQDNKIVLSGSPIYNPGLWNLYESKIASL